ncbi:hypothetical protein Fmac_018907 [Flemingia macrophylla]|uniref:WRKY domain-containing protein n=1 Tax=Flemingia macrophylla TaxID=520843 RepID=A0ABD1M6C7_9FABA
MENQILNGKKAMEEELIRGRDMANQLLGVLVHDKLNAHVEEEDGSKSVLPFVEELVRKVLCSFTNTLLLLNSNNDVSNEVAANITLRDVSSFRNFPKLESLDESCKSGNILNPTNRRRCYKRKSNAPTWEKDSSVLVEDGYAWRKSYYRCTYKNDQGCQAIKQVQRIQDDPPLYRTTYYGHHTCKSPMNPEIILEPVSSSASTILLSFNNNSLQSKQENPFSSSLIESRKHEPQQMINDDHVFQNQLSALENLLYDYDTSFDHSRNATLLSSTKPVELENVYEQFGF